MSTTLELYNYHPITQTFSLVKLLECVIVNGLSWWLQKNKFSAPGCRVFAKIIQQPINASDSTNSSMMGSSHLSTNVLMPLSSIIAGCKYDKVCCTCLVKRMLRLSVNYFTSSGWWHGSLTARPKSASMREICHSHTFKEYLPQCSVLSQLLFTVFINHPLNSVDDSTHISAYACELTLVCAR